MGVNYGDISQDVAMVNATLSHQMSFSYAEMDAGTQTVSVDCSNPVSSQNLSMNVLVVWDNVTLVREGGDICRRQQRSTSSSRTEPHHRFQIDRPPVACDLGQCDCG